MFIYQNFQPPFAVPTITRGNAYLWYLWLIHFFVCWYVCVFQPQFGMDSPIFGIISTAIKYKRPEFHKNAFDCCDCYCCCTELVSRFGVICHLSRPKIASIYRHILSTFVGCELFVLPVCNDKITFRNGTNGNFGLFILFCLFNEFIVIFVTWFGPWKWTSCA